MNKANLETGNRSNGIDCYACTANGDIEKECWIDKGKRGLCWIDEQPGRKEDCEYWELTTTRN